METKNEVKGIDIPKDVKETRISESLYKKPLQDGTYTAEVSSKNIIPETVKFVGGQLGISLKFTNVETKKGEIRSTTIEMLKGKFVDSVETGKCNKSFDTEINGKNYLNPDLYFVSENGAITII